ncbi:hypothetical protein DFR86_10620 [Acidianus sulfidivorans JP7]|uniref:Uncharacterized protein n=1 Tax=Acidianus sulfidivorans JP7 TaxID=619593 RepID=A0A2U9IPK4_9CREN|nr:hypothetical protein [Acidianus sulfidivorans]AWR97942.1 hypothetical protein DFR86_10620 [Acidianus sulfidivorans JP7]
MDKYYFALLGEAGAAGLAKAFYLRFKKSELKDAYEEEVSHWNYFRRFKRSRLEPLVYYALFFFGILVSIFGFNFTRLVIRRVEKAAINFYLKNFDPEDSKISSILEEEKKHMMI